MRQDGRNTYRTFVFRGLQAESEKSSKEAVWAEIRPRAGIMVGLPVFEKARSIKHCCQLVGRREVSVERKYDGEYCQIPIQRHRTGHDISIFSKSGRDSTRYRVGLHENMMMKFIIKIPRFQTIIFSYPPPLRPQAASHRSSSHTPIQTPSVFIKQCHAAKVHSLSPPSNYHASHPNIRSGTYSNPAPPPPADPT